jgi:thymidylate kinase
MNKLIVICGGDRLGKGTLIKGLCETFDYKNITIRHCDKPPKDLLNDQILDYQLKAFEQEFELIHYVQTMNRKFMYHDNIIIYDRFHLGEFVYGQLFRNYDANLLKTKILALEEKNLRNNIWFEPYLITLTADSEFFLNKEDGNSFSKNLEEKTKELQLFKETHDFSVIKNKLLVKVDENGSFRSKEEILNEVINFIK